MSANRFAVLVASTLVAGSACASPPPEPPPEQAVMTGTSIMADLMADVAQAREKIVGLARAIPEDKYAWRPATGVRSVAEMFKHVASDNYLIPIATGATPPAESGITSDYTTAGAYESRDMSKDAIVAELEKSFDFLENAMSATTDDRLSDSIDIFGQQGTVQKLWVLATTHLHEHLGQGIAYARSNAVVPPWSQ